ncbi:MAG TPA: glycosyltransferase N-terminal domain-containing protein [Pedobacter sp.]|nr:glycosyltransferase N-terminal domain-containing protein [Pedobacter sp.]
MIWIYNIGIALFTVITKFASIFNQKAKLFTQGRKNVFEKIAAQVDPDDRSIWFHFASLGEFEQGRPVVEKIKSIDSSQKIVITFFSPSGFEIRKNYAGADGIFYLPIDTAANAKKFLQLVNPKMAIFTKYEFWFHYFTALHQNQIPLYLIAGIFRPSQAFFKWYGNFNRRMLKCVSHFFVQNQESVDLLNSIGINEVSISGDTRFDRVYENAISPRRLPEIEVFCGESPILIAGSTWLADEKLLASFPQKYPDWKLIIAPHEVNEQHIQEIEKLFPRAVKFSRIITHGASSNEQVLLIDNIGMLSSLYQYGKIAYIGGGFGAGIHNTLEAAAFGLPVIFGPKYDKFQEAKDLINHDAARSITNEVELLSAFNYFVSNENSSSNAKKYVENQKGATAIIMTNIF